jgi:hypothetical protein
MGYETTGTVKGHNRRTIDCLTPDAAATPRLFGVGGKLPLGCAASLQHDQDD